MNLSERDIELIEGRLEGSLSPDEVEEFEDRYATSDAFRKEVTFQRNLLGGIDAVQRKSLKDELRELFATTEIKIENRSTSQWYWAAATLIILISAVFIYTIVQNDRNDLISKYFQPYPAQTVVRGDRDVGSEMVMQLYALKKYEQFIQAVRNQNKDGATFENQSLFLGCALLAIGKEDEAIQEFKKISISEPNYPDAMWYESLALILAGNESEARKILIFLGKDSTYKSSAKSLLRDLED